VNDRIVVTYEADHGPGKPHRPVMLTHALVESGIPEHGKRFYLCILGSGCSKTWITDFVANELIRRIAP
jgi:hypothetical protein